MLAVENKKKYTVADYMLLEEGAPFQLINNDLVMSPSPIPQHQIISGKLFIKVSAFLEQTDNNGVAMYSPMDVYLDDGNIYQPDLLYISEDRIDIIKKRIEGPPDLIIEILSPSNAYYDLRHKKDMYEKYGVKEYIIVDPIAKNIEVYVLKDSTYQLHQKAQQNEQLKSVLLAGFSVELSTLFK